MSELIPHEIRGWKIQEEAKKYNRETIFEYIDGAGEVYRMYAFRELEVFRFTKPDEPDIVLEMFDMTASVDAFGVFTHGREGEEVCIGQGSDYRGGLLCFWKDKYFVCIYAEGTSEKALNTVLDLGKTIDGAIIVIGPKPEVLKYLPQGGLIENSLRFFHTHVSLNYHYFLADSNILNLDDKTDAVLARYDKSEGKSLLLLISYPNEDLAHLAFNGFMIAYMPEAQETHVLQTEDSTWVAAKTEHNVVAIVFEAVEKEAAERLLREVVVIK
ncbi:MAG: hypothetical protein JSV84_01225 [Gemmatimonadota bacterium]|nr:MAG: hypothetical protein JSV84_01225 [Gemmatimonadota bacterium]